MTSRGSVARDLFRRVGLLGAAALARIDHQMTPIEAFFWVIVGVVILWGMYLIKSLLPPPKPLRQGEKHEKSVSDLTRYVLDILMDMGMSYLASYVWQWFQFYLVDKDGKLSILNIESTTGIIVGIIAAYIME